MTSAQNETMEKSRSAAVAQQNDGDDEIDLLALLYRLLEKAGFIVAMALVGVLLMGVYSFGIAKPVYEATTKLYLLNSKDTAISLSDLQIGSQLASDYQEVFKNWHVHEMVIQKLGLPYTYTQMQNAITVTNPSSTRILYITARNGDPDQAKLIADTYADVAREFIAAKMDAEMPNIFEEALRPSRPASPNKARNLLLGFILGFVFGCAVVSVQFLMDDRIRSAEDIEKYFEIPTLGMLPVQATSRSKHKDRKDVRA